MIEFLLGKTGSGKSYLALKRAAEFLREWGDEGIIRTNLAIHTGKLNAYLKKHYPEIEPDVVGRVFFLEDQQVRQFFLYREPGNTLEMTSKEEQQNLRFPDFEKASDKAGKHVLYIIDEAHLFFDSREWQNVGLTLNFFCSQHRKFRSDIIFVTQFLDQVEKRLRNHATLFTECVNYGVRRLMLWKMPKLFRTYETPKPPPYPAEYKGTCRMDFELADCYDTTAGVGAKGGRPPEKKRQKGLPFWTFPALLGAAVVALWMAPDVLVGGAFKMLGNNEDVLQQKVQAAVVPSPIQKEGTIVNQTSPPAINNVPGSLAETLPREVIANRPVPKKVRGYVVRGNQAVVVLEDGTRVTNDDPEWGGIEKRGNAVWIDNRRLFLVDAYVPPPKPQSAPKAKETPPAGPSSAEPGHQYVGEGVVPSPESVQASLRTLEPSRAFTGQGGAGASGGPRSGPRRTSP